MSYKKRIIIVPLFILGFSFSLTYQQDPAHATEVSKQTESTSQLQSTQENQNTEQAESTSSLQTTQETPPTGETESTSQLQSTQENQNTEQAESTSSLQATRDSSEQPSDQGTEEVLLGNQQGIPVYRVYNPNSGEHLHTMNSNEKDNLVNHGWRYEGISMYIPNSGRELYRAYNPNSGEHFWTLNWNEISNIKRHGWKYEGVAWHTPNSGAPMYRVFNPNSRGAGSHHYTSIVSERDSLTRHGWRNEGVAWYTLGGSQPVKSYVLLNAPYINQNSSGYPMGCEAASLLEALQNKGHAKNYNLRSFIKEMPLAANNNPNDGFAGRPDKIMPGVYQSIFAAPLAKWGTRYGNVSNISGSSTESLKNELRNGHPIVVYVTLNFAAPQWGNYWWGSGVNNAHIMTLDGFNDSNQTYHVADPNAGKYWVSASRFEGSYNIRKSAVVVK